MLDKPHSATYLSVTIRREGRVTAEMQIVPEDSGAWDKTQPYQHEFDLFGIMVLLGTNDRLDPLTRKEYQEAVNSLRNHMDAESIARHEQRARNFLGQSAPVTVSAGSAPGEKVVKSGRMQLTVITNS